MKKPSSKPSKKPAKKTPKKRPRKPGKPRIGPTHPTSPVPADPKKRMSWDLNRLAWEVGRRLQEGKPLDEIRDWLDPTGTRPVRSRQKTAPVSHERMAKPQTRFLGVIVERIVWQIDGVTNKPVGFVLEGVVYRDRATGSAIEPKSFAWPGSPPKMRAYAFSSSSYSSSLRPSSSSSSSKSSQGPGW
jgi:hypothetical protein